MLKSEVTSNSDYDFEPIPSGTYFGRCVSIIDLGTQTETYQGKTSQKPKMMVVWEIPEHRFSGQDGAEGPRTLSVWYTVSLNEKANLRRDLESWRGKQFEEGDWFEYKNLLGQACLLGVMQYTNQNGKERNKITSVQKLPQAYPEAPLESTLTYFDLSEFNQSTFDGLSEKLQEKIMQSSEWANKSAAPLASAPQQWNKESENPAPDDFADEIPF